MTKNFTYNFVEEIFLTCDQYLAEKFALYLHLTTRKLDFCGPESHLRTVQYWIWNLHQISGNVCTLPSLNNTKVLKNIYINHTLWFMGKNQLTIL